MYNIKKYMMEIIVLSILFTIIALYLNIHGENETVEFVTNHIIALFVVLITSKLIYNLLKNRI